MAPRTDRHLDSEAAERYSLGEIPEEELALWEEHLLICAACRSKVEAEGAYLAAMRAAGARLRREAKERSAGKKRAGRSKSSTRAGKPRR